MRSIMRTGVWSFVKPIAAAVVLATAPMTALAQAQDIVAAISSQLRAQGYDEIVVGRTLLGRSRILATSSEYRREIIVNPRTGEILRDYWSLLPGAAATGADGAPIIAGGGRASGSDDDDDGDGNSGPGGGDDNSGPGGGDDDHSGSGGDGSGSGSDDD